MEYSAVDHVHRRYIIINYMYLLCIGLGISRSLMRGVVSDVYKLTFSFDKLTPDHESLKMIMIVMVSHFIISIADLTP